MDKLRVAARGVPDGFGNYGWYACLPAWQRCRVLYKYDPTTDTYAILPSPAVADGTTAAYLNGKIYKLGRVRIVPPPSPVDITRLEIYDIASASWSFGADYPRLARFVRSFVSGGRIYTIGGTLTSFTGSSNKTYEYDPATDTWNDHAIEDLPTGRSGGVNHSQTAGAFMRAVTDRTACLRHSYPRCCLATGGEQVVNAFGYAGWTGIDGRGST